MKQKRKPTRKLYPSEIVRRLDAMDKRWPDGLMLFACNGSLALIKQSTGEVIEWFDILCDGGAPDTYTIDDKDFIVFD